MQDKISRRDFLKIGASGVAAMILARCAAPPAATEAPVAPVAPVGH